MTALVRQPFVDEGLLADPAWNYLQTGGTGTVSLNEHSFGISTIRTPLTRIEDHTYWTLPLHIAAQVVWYRLTGFGLLQMRFLSIAWSLVALSALYLVCEALEIPGSLLAVGFLATDFIFLTQAAHGRPDMMCLALWLTGLAAFLRLRERHLGAALFACASLAGASCLTHPLGAIGVVVAALMIWQLDAKRLAWRHLPIVVAPFVLWGMAWGLYALQDFAAFRDQLYMNGSTRAAAVFGPVEGLRREIVLRYLATFGVGGGPFAGGHAALRPLLFVIPLTYFGALVTGWSMRLERGARILVRCVTAAIVVLVFADDSKKSFYLIHTHALLAPVLAAVLVSLWRSGRAGRVLSTGVALLLAAVQLGPTVLRVHVNPLARDYTPVMSQLLPRVSPGDPKGTIVGSDEIGFVLGFDHIQDDEWLGYLDGVKPSTIVLDFRYKLAVAALRRRDAGFDTYVARLLPEYRQEPYSNGQYTVLTR